MLLVDESTRGERGRLALLDYGLMAELGSKEREGMVRKQQCVVFVRGGGQRENEEREREKEEDTRNAQGMKRGTTYRKRFKEGTQRACACIGIKGGERDAPHRRESTVRCPPCTSPPAYLAA